LEYKLGQRSIAAMPNLSLQRPDKRRYNNLANSLVAVLLVAQGIMADDQKFGTGFASAALVFQGRARPAKRKSNGTSMIMHCFDFEGVARTSLTRFNCLLYPFVCLFVCLLRFFESVLSRLRAQHIQNTGLGREAKRKNKELQEQHHPKSPSFRRACARWDKGTRIQ